MNESSFSESISRISGFRNATADWNAVSSEMQRASISWFFVSPLSPDFFRKA